VGDARFGGFHAFVSWIVLTIAQLCMGVALPWTVILFPVVMLPLLLGCLGVSWFLAAIGVYFRDVAQITGTLATLLLFFLRVLRA
jgi:lipopolysaccharide transport system permease protein